MKYDATRFRSSCSQPVVNPDAPFTTWSTSPYEWDQRLGLQQTDAQRNATSEDCLYLNIYTINETGSGSSSHYPGPKRRLPILVFLDGLDHLVGSGNRYPGHVLAQMGMVVVTVNYRLGPFGYLATRSHLNGHTWVDDSVNNAHGNYGLWDQVEALKFIRNNAAKFFGDPDEITLVGHGSAAADVALHLLSKHSARRTPPLFQRAILISGSDQMEGGFARHPDESAAYAAELAHQVGCDTSTDRLMLECLRARPAPELATAAGQTRIHRPNWMTKAWSPTQDGDFINDMPERLWESGHFAHIPLIGGLAVDGGVVYALASLCRLDNAIVKSELEQIFTNAQRQDPPPSQVFRGITHDVLKQAFDEMVRRDFASDPNALSDALVTEYTDWSNLSDPYKQWVMYREAWTDRMIGSGLVETIRFHSTPQDTSMPNYPNVTQMFVFAYRDEQNPWSRVLGSYGGSELQYLFGLPHLTIHKSQEDLRREWPDDLGLKPPDANYTNLDRNMSDYMMFLVSNFVKSANATPTPVRNLTWDTYRPENRTYMWLNLTSGYYPSRSHRPDLEVLGDGAGFDLRQNYRVYRHAYWNRLYPIQLTWLPRFTPPPPTPAYLTDYRTSAMSLIALKNRTYVTRRASLSDFIN
ncbi:unnamed protein product [Dicrocoelium dendriticum]|nr:unnamed protein product [Dicrocoelium dendriticum]